MDFETAWKRYETEIKRLSHTQYVPGLDPDDVASEMSICLWRATQTYRSGTTPFGTYWWSLWLNRRSDIADAYYAMKRVRPVLVDSFRDTDKVCEDKPMFPMPPTTDPLGRAVWGALAQGDTPKEVQDDNEISRRRYYAVIASLRTREVRAGLLDGGG